MYILTLFNYVTKPAEPLCSVIYDGKKLRLFNFYLPGTGQTLARAHKNLETMREILLRESPKIILNDYKAHIEAFDLPKDIPHNIYDTALYVDTTPTSPSEARALIDQLIPTLIEQKPQRWMKLRAQAAVVYSYLEARGVFYAYKVFHPHYSQHTFTGRSKTSGFNLQGLPANDEVRPLQGHEWLLCFDWLAADIRTLSILSQDENMLQSFETSDPYTFMAGDELDRKFCKIELLKAINALNYNHEILDFFPQFREWMKGQILLIKEQQYLESIMGRKFWVDKQDIRSYRRVFNATAQGSVVHAMQAALVAIYGDFRAYIVTEIHDSIVGSSNRSMLELVTNSIGQHMAHPFEGILSENPLFPIKISIGHNWKKWEKWKEIRWQIGSKSLV